MDVLSVTADTGTVFRAVNPTTRTPLDPEFRESSARDVDGALHSAQSAFELYARVSAHDRARFLRAIAQELSALGDELLERAHAETGLPLVRLQGERTRTTNQLLLFADTIEEGSWLEARIDTGDPARAPIPKPDLRRMLIPLGPVAVFAASNFPLAFSAPGGDTASALAAGCTVVCKAHPAHPGTAELAAHAIQRAAENTGMPHGAFTLLHGWSHDVGLALVQHPLTQAVGFTGSLRGGRAIFDAAMARPEPIPVYAEMGSINPVFLLPSALAERADALAEALAQSITQGVGQFCTNPGVLLGVRGPAFDRLQARLTEQLSAAPAGVMLYDRLHASFTQALEQAQSLGVTVLAGAQLNERAAPALLLTDAARFIEQPQLREEMFGPVSMLVAASDAAELERVAESLEGQLTATIQGNEQELLEHARLVEILRRKVGRLLFNGVPTGVEVGHAMQHGGPYPASTDARTTSVGTAAIARFVRPVCYQNFPDVALPEALRNRNVLGSWRLVNGRLTQDDV